MKDAISLGVGEPDFDTPWHIRDEGIYSLEKGRTFYTSNAGLKELKIEICNYLKRRFDVEYDYNKEVMVTVGLFGNGRIRTFVFGVIFSRSFSFVRRNLSFSSSWIVTGTPSAKTVHGV